VLVPWITLVTACRGRAGVALPLNGT